MTGRKIEDSCKTSLENVPVGVKITLLFKSAAEQHYVANLLEDLNIMISSVTQCR